MNLSLDGHLRLAVAIALSTAAFFLATNLRAGGSTEICRLARMMQHHPQFAWRNAQPLPAAHLKTILLWNSWFHMDDAFFFGTGQEPFVDAHCPVSDCYVSNDLYLMPPSEYDAILFFYPTLTSVPFTYSRRVEQLYVFVNEEPPVMYRNNVNISRFNGFFNLTASYRQDSDIHWPYGSVRPVGVVPKVARPVPGTNFAAGKSKLVAWFVSNCHSDSRREDYVRLLKKYIDVDVYGKCGNESDPKVCWLGDQNNCYEMLERDYKFYLSFENSFCRDYVTEKFFEILDRRVVPVVFGAANYSKLAPADSFIDATQMGARRLAQLLLRIDKDDALYNQFFWWKPYYVIEKKRSQLARQAFCQLCQRLHQQAAHPQRRQIYRDFEGWWGSDQHCHHSLFVIPFKEYSFQKVDMQSIRPWVDNHTWYQPRDSL